jgi:hypothetical protein
MASLESARGRTLSGSLGLAFIPRGKTVAGRGGQAGGPLETRLGVRRKPGGYSWMDT